MPGTESSWSRATVLVWTAVAALAVTLAVVLLLGPRGKGRRRSRAGAEVRGAPIDPAPTQKRHVGVSGAPIDPAPKETLPATLRGGPIATAPRKAPVAKAPEEPAPDPPAKLLPDASGLTHVTIQYLSDFPFSPADEQPKGQDFVPPRIRALSGRRIVVAGYMLPADFKDGTCTQFILSNCPPGCCFGCTVPPNGWISVKSKGGKPVPCSGPSPLVRVEGVLRVLPKDGDTLSAGLYSMTATSVRAGR
jgi:hypothetical protein